MNICICYNKFDSTPQYCSKIFLRFIPKLLFVKFPKIGRSMFCRYNNKQSACILFLYVVGQVFFADDFREHCKKNCANRRWTSYKNERILYLKADMHYSSSRCIMSKWVIFKALIICPSRLAYTTGHQIIKPIGQ